MIGGPLFPRELEALLAMAQRRGWTLEQAAAAPAAALA